MKTHPLCLECFVRNAMRYTERVTGDKKILEKIERSVREKIKSIDMSMPPPYMTRIVCMEVASLTGLPDSYIEEKDYSTKLASELMERLNADPGFNTGDFEKLVRLSVAGNIIDFGVDCHFDFNKARRTVASAFEMPIDTAAVERLKNAAENAGNILFIHDNCGEAVFDREFIRPYREKTTLCVRGKPILNDLTRRELKDSGLENFAKRVVDTGDCSPGICFETSSKEFIDAFDSADLVIAKGMGNYETLSGIEGKRICFLFMAKCPAIAEDVGAEIDSLQVVTRGL